MTRSEERRTKLCRPVKREFERNMPANALDHTSWRGVLAAQKYRQLCLRNDQMQLSVLVRARQALLDAGLLNEAAEQLFIHAVSALLHKRS